MAGEDTVHSDQAEAPDVFISYAREDQERVRYLDNFLTDQGRKVWVDWGSIHPSSEWSIEIETGIRSASAFLFIVSPDSAASLICLQELATAVELNKRIIPIICRDVLHQDAPAEIAKRQWIFMRETDDFDAATVDLLTALDVDINWLRGHNALLSQALAWQDAGSEASRLLKGDSLRQAESWLAEAAGKEPTPAQLHLAFVQASRQRATKLLRRITAGAVAGMVLTLGLTIWALFFTLAAQTARDFAQAEQLNSEAELAGSERAELIERSALLAIESYFLNPFKDSVSDIPLRRAISLLAKASAHWDNPDMPIIDATFLDAGRVAFALNSPAGNVLVIANSATAPEHQAVIDAGTVRELESCANGTVLAVRSRENGVMLYNTGDMSLHKQLIRQSNSTTVLCDDQSNLLVVGWQDGVVSIHDASNGEHKLDLEAGLGSSVLSLALDAGQQLVAAGSFDRDSYKSPSCPPLAERASAEGIVNRLRIWSLASGQQVSTSPHCRPVAAIDFSPDGGGVATASDSGVYLWSLADGVLQGRLGHQTNVNSVSFNADGTVLVSSSGWSAYLWNPYNNRRLRQLQHQGPVTSAQFSPDGTQIVTASNDHTARLWRAADGRELLRFPHYRDRVLPGDNPYLVATSFAADGEQILTAGRDGRVTLWTTSLTSQVDLVGGSNIDLSTRTNNLNQRVWSGNGTYFAQRISVDDWELRQLPGNTLIMAFQSPSPLLALDVSASARQMAASTFAGEILLFDIPDSRQTQALNLSCDASANQLRPPEQCFARSLSLNETGSFLLSGSLDGYARYWSVDDGQLLWQHKEAGTMLMGSAISPTGELIATGGTDRIARIRDAFSGKLIHEFQHSHDVKDLAFSPDGDQLASASSDGLARVFDLRGDNPTRYLQHHFPIESVAYNSSGDRLVTASTDRTVRVWELETSYEVSRIELDGPAVLASFISDAEILAIDSRQASVHKVNMESMIQQACDRLTRNLDALEWIKFRGLDVAPRATCPGLPAPRLP